MKWRSYIGGAWYDTLYCGPRFTCDWWRRFWECGIMGNLSYYATKWFGWKPWLSPKQRRLLKAIEELERLEN